MASIVKRRSKYYARVSLWDGSRQRFKEIPLRTKYREDALLRLATIEKVENDIKAGTEFSFPWLSETGPTEIIKMTVQDAMDKFMEDREYNGLAPSTIIRNNQSLTHFSNIVGKYTPVDAITSDHISRFKKYSTSKLKHSANGMNINLRLIKTFLRWCAQKNYTSNVPYVMFVKTPKSLPSYLSDSSWEKLMELDSIDALFKRIFFFYRETGCRLSEPIHGVLKGNWLVIPAEFTKAKVEKEIQLDAELKEIWRELNEYKENWVGQGRQVVNLTGKISKSFYTACNEIGRTHKFHDLRHTFAVRKYLEHNNIYKVRDLLGHQTVKTTEIYAKFSLMRLKDDFPSILGSKSSD